MAIANSPSLQNELCYLLIDHHIYGKIDLSNVSLSMCFLSHQIDDSKLHHFLHTLCKPIKCNINVTINAPPWAFGLKSLKTSMDLNTGNSANKMMIMIISIFVSTVTNVSLFLIILKWHFSKTSHSIHTLYKHIGLKGDLCTCWKTVASKVTWDKGLVL